MALLGPVGRFPIDDDSPSMSSYSSAFTAAFPLVADHIQARASALAELPTLPAAGEVDRAFAALAAELPDEGWGTERTTRHLLDEVVGGLAMGQAGPHVRLSLVRPRALIVETTGADPRILVSRRPALSDRLPSRLPSAPPGGCSTTAL